MRKLNQNTFAYTALKEQKYKKLRKKQLFYVSLWL